MAVDKNKFILKAQIDTIGKLSKIAHDSYDAFAFFIIGWMGVIIADT
jgi:hypothetical protein